MNEAQLRALTFSHRAARLAMAGVATGLFEEHEESKTETIGTRSTGIFMATTFL